MNGIEKTSFWFLLVCIVFLFGSIALFGLMRYTSYENIFIPPADFKNSSVNALTQSTNLESLKKACLYWAERKDSDGKFIDELISQFDFLLYSMIKWTMFLSVFFGGGFVSIYLRLRKFRIENQNAL